MRVSAEAIASLLSRLFKAHGSQPGEAAEVARHLVDSNLAGHDSHGVMRAPWYLEKVENGEIVPGAEFVVLQESETTATCDGNWGFGQPIARQAMELAIAKATSLSLACVTVKNCNHVGRLGAYTQLASRRGMIGIGMANLHGTSHCVAPFGGIDRKLPTNPLSVAFRRGQPPDFLLDMTSSIVAEGKLKMKLNLGEPLPEGWAIDSEGRPAEWPRQFYDTPRGAIQPLGGSMGHKGFALSLAIDALAGALSGAGCSSLKSTRHGNACLFLVMRIDAFCAVDEFEAKVDDLTSHVTRTRLAPGVEQVLIPGEPEHQAAARGRREGIEIDGETWRQLGDWAARAGESMDDMGVELARGDERND